VLFEVPIGRLVDLAIGLSLLEAGLLALYRKRTGRGVGLDDYALNLASGLCLMLALRAAVAGAGWAVIALFLAAAGAAHWTDLWCRWRRGPGKP
jgi:hypothetical protein